MSTYSVDPETALLSASGPRPYAEDEPHQSRPEVEGSSYQTASDGQLLPPANFRPFFTLVEDDVTGEHYHPNVHYFFSDDDRDGLTSSILDNMHAQNDPDHRLLLLDVAQDGRTVALAHSLNSAWQISSVTTDSAPSWTDAGPTTAPEGLMLKIRGQEAQKQADQGKRPPKSENPVQRMEADIEAYMERLTHLQTVLAKGDSVQ